MRKLLILILLVPLICFSASHTYILSEGNMGYHNSSLWECTDGIKTDSILNIGDVGQSMKIYNGKMYAIMNNSHSINIYEIGDNLNKSAVIDLKNALPRYMEIVNGIGYVTCWDTKGIISIDLQNNTIQDTVLLDRLPEDIVSQNGKLYTSANMVEYLGASDSVVFEIDISKEAPEVTDTFEVVKGPGPLLINEGKLWVSSTYYDSEYNTYCGVSKINLNTKKVTKKDYGISFNFSADLIKHDSNIYRAYKNGIVQINKNLSFDEDSKIGDLPANVYSVAKNNNRIYLGTTSDSLGTVFVMDFQGNTSDTFKVGAYPGSFAFYNSNQTSFAEGNGVNNNEFTLNQNYPNPFNPVTNISYQIPRKSKVKIAIYDLKGRKIKTLVDQKQSQGTHRVRWEARNSQGERVATGVYFYQLQTRNQVKTGKMLYMK